MKHMPLLMLVAICFAFAPAGAAEGDGLVGDPGVGLTEAAVGTPPADGSGQAIRPSGRPHIRSVAPLALSDALVVFGVTPGSITSNSALITWSTNLASDSQVEYGPSSVYGNAAAQADLVTSHAVTISGLAPSSICHFRVSSREVGGDVATSADSQFTTTGSISMPVISDISSTSDTLSSVWISWQTNEGASSQVAYGLTSAYGGLSPRDSSLSTSHTVHLSGLVADTTNHFSVISQNGFGYEASSDDGTFAIRSDGGGNFGSGNGASASGSCNAGSLSVLLVLGSLLAGLAFFPSGRNARSPR